MILWGYTRFENEQRQQTIALPTNFTKINAAAFAIDKYGLTCFSVQKLSLSNIIFNGEHVKQDGYPIQCYWLDIGV